MSSCSLIISCHAQAVNGSWAIAKSDWRRIAPWSARGVGDLGGGLTGGGREGLVTLEEDLQEDLSVEREGRRVEGDGLAVVDEGVRARDGVRDEEVDKVGGREAGIGHTREDLVHVVLGLGDEAQGGGGGRVGATSKEFKAGSARAVRDGDGTGELDKITGGDLECLEERLQVVDGIVNTVVGGCIAS